MKTTSLMPILALIITGWLVAPVFAAPGPPHTPTVRYYKAAISLTSVSAGSTSNAFSITITNCDTAACDSTHVTTSTQAMGSATVTVPAAFSNVISLSTSATGSKTWNATLVSSTIQLEASGGTNKLDPGESVVVTFNADASCDAGDYTWTTAAYQDTPLAITTPYTLFGNQPKVTITGSCITLADMPVNKLINGESATCTGNPPDANGNPNEARPCYYTQAGLTLLDTDPRFEINVYTTVNGLPGNALAGGGAFPQAGVKIAPQFDTKVPPGTSFTMCEAPDTTTTPTPYTLTSVTITVTGGPSDGVIVNPPIYFYQGHACFNATVPEGATEFAVDLNNSIVCSYTQGAYGNTGSSGYGVLSTNFFGGKVVYPNGVQVGDQTTIGTLDGATHGFGLLLTTPQAVAAYLPPKGTGQGGVEGVLTQDYQDPLDNANPHPTGFAPQVLTLQINTDLGDAGAFLPGGGGIGNFTIFTGIGSCGNGETVSQFLVDANKALSGLTPLPLNCSVADLQALADALNNSYDECVAGPTSNLFNAPVPSQD